MKEQDLIKILEDFSKRVEYIREDLKKDEKGAKKGLKTLLEAKDGLLSVIDNNLNSILGTFGAIEVLDEIIKKIDKEELKFSDKEISKYEKD